MPYTSPNQRVIHIHREPLNNSFLGINNDSWKEAARVLGAPAFVLYMYLAANKDNFNLALSPAAVQKEIGMARSTYYDQFRNLEALGYLQKGQGNIYHFYENPLRLLKSEYSAPAAVQNDYDYPARGKAYLSSGVNSTGEDIEIYNKSSPEDDKYILPRGNGWNSSFDF